MCPLSIYPAQSTRWQIWDLVPIFTAIRKLYSTRWPAFSGTRSLNHPDTSNKESGSSGKNCVRLGVKGGFRNTT
ncbi:hypothetical protein PHMEG_0004940 [Phytophthora megakarya]|uniref:Uncharacterized protein n=1 Tax=Phytophthora megakarya TaxID=4795 RepID=A0A225WU74_9STRA|nr:hypothetical protein PHMEG_0004940 [Phytophthora megakarya]